MKIKSTLFIYLFAVLNACNSHKISENEDKGISEVLSNYGGYCKYSIIWTASTVEEKTKKFELVLSKSVFIEKFSDFAQMWASGIAYSFYKNLREEKVKYTHIKSVLVFKDGTRQEHEYTMEQLELVHTKMEIVEKVFRLIQARKFDDLKPLLNDSTYVKYDKNVLIGNLEKYDVEFGNALNFLPLGFRFDKLENNINNLHIAGQIIRSQQTNNFSIDLDINDSASRVVYLNYKF